MIFMDYLYLVLVLPAILLSFWASIRVKSVFKKYSQQPSSMTGYEMARSILDANALYNVQIEQISQELGDHYDPRANVIRLSESVYNNASVSSVGVAAHEAGHALQYAEAYMPIKIRSKVVTVTNFTAKTIVPIMTGGFLLYYLSGIYEIFYVCVILGIVVFSASALFQLITLPTEFNASKRAVRVIENSGRFSQEETKGVKKVLSAAALTYVAALLVSLTQLLRFIVMASRRNRR